jgi:hypothetical protein
VTWDEQFQELADAAARLATASNLNTNVPGTEAIFVVERMCARLYGKHYRTPSVRGQFYGTHDLAQATSGFDETSTRPNVEHGTVLLPMVGATLDKEAMASLSRTSLYSNLSVLVAPVDLSRTELGYSNVGVMARDAGPYRQVLEINAQIAPLVRSGQAIVLPRSASFGFESMTHGMEVTRWSAPIVQRSPDYLPLNIGAELFTACDSSPFIDIALLEDLRLPFFPEASLENIARVAIDETDAFRQFLRFLHRKLREMQDANSSVDVKSTRQEIEDGVYQLRTISKKLALDRGLALGQSALFGLSVVLLTVPSEVTRNIAAIVGSVNLMQLAQTVAMERKTSLDLRSSDFYIPFLLSQQAEQGFD